MGPWDIVNYLSIIRISIFAHIIIVTTLKRMIVMYYFTVVIFTQTYADIKQVQLNTLNKTTIHIDNLRSM